jgi:2-oxoglutarate dehydrogenase complex dehydrogenase (E1) component-like enzyme
LPELDPARYGLKGSDRYKIDGILKMPGGVQEVSVDEIVEHFKKTYLGSIGFEFGHIPVCFGLIVF